LVDNHEVPLGLPVSKNRGCVHGNVDVPIFHFFVEGVYDFFLTEGIPTALHSGIIVDNTSTLVIRSFLLASRQQETTENTNYAQDRSRDPGFPVSHSAAVYFFLIQ